MPIVKLGKEVQNDWRRLGDDEPVSTNEKITVSLARFNKERDALTPHAQKGFLGIYLQSDQPPALIAADIGLFSVIELDFPKFADGRAYSYARILREQLGYKKELRASGNILRDQYIFMLRCGFDCVEVADPQRVPGFAEAMKEFSVFYQPAADDRKPAWQIRHQI